jgi:hypothetical protein
MVKLSPTVLVWVPGLTLTATCPGIVVVVVLVVVDPLVSAHTNWQSVPPGQTVVQRHIWSWPLTWSQGVPSVHSEQSVVVVEVVGWVEVVVLMVVVLVGLVDDVELGLVVVVEVVDVGLVVVVVVVALVVVVVVVDLVVVVVVVDLVVVVVVVVLVVLVVVVVGAVIVTEPSFSVTAARWVPFMFIFVPVRSSVELPALTVENVMYASDEPDAVVAPRHAASMPTFPAVFILNDCGFAHPLR